MNVVIKRQIPGVELTKICEFPKEVYDLDETERGLEWLFKIFKEKNYEPENRDWNFPRNPTITFAKKLPSQPHNFNWRDVWVITLEPCENPEKVAKYISSVLIK